MSAPDSLLSRTTLFTGASAQTIARVGEHARLMKVPSGAALFRKGDPADSLLLIRRGIVQIVRPGEEAVTLGIFGPREPVGLSAMLDRAHYPADAIAACDVEVVRAPADIVLDAMAEDHGLALSINRALIAHTRALQAKIAMLTAGEVSARLATLLSHLADRFGDEDEEGKTVVPVALSRGDLARLVGVRPETVIRVMSRWQKAGLVETSAEGFRITDCAALT